MKRIGSLTLLVVALALLFSGCSRAHQINQPNQDISLENAQTQRIAVDNAALEQINQDTQNNMQGDSFQITNQQVSTTNEQGEPMKQLSDFKEIAATQATLVTDKGNIVIELFRNETPITTANFLELADSGFYDGIRFHRIIEDFMAQVGDPLSKDLSQQAAWGTGGPGYVIPDEFSDTLRHDAAGIVSMANRGPETGGSQFFITYEPTPWLDGKHTVFGKVTVGMDVVEKLEIGDAITSVILE